MSARIRRTTVASVLVVAGVAATASYAHMRSLGLRAGEGWRADVLPLSVDGLLVAASLVIYVRRRAGLHAGWLPWLGLVLGVLASVAANIAAAEPTVLGRVVAAWPPLAFALSFELLVTVLRDGTAQTSTGRPQIDAETPDDPAEGARTRESDPVTELIEQGAGRRRLARELSISEHQARQLIEQRNGVAR
jgi:hypothetical protein